MKDNKLLYRLTRPIITFLFKLIYKPTFKGLENIPKKGAIILAGNHTSSFDPLLLISSTKRSIHFLAKLELFKGPKKIIFNNMGLIPVDRKNKTTKPLEQAKRYLDIGAVVLIFPEGTTEKNKGLLKFKTGSVVLAKNTNTKIVPFVIKGKYKPFKGGITLEFLESIKVSGDINHENDRLRDIISKNMEVD